MKKIISIFSLLLGLLLFSQSVLAGSVTLPTDLYSSANQADYLIITADAFSESPSLLALAHHRANYSNFNVAIVKLSQIYRQFPQPQNDQSIKDFISFAYFYWESPSPNYILLVGDADIGKESQEWFLPAHFAYIFSSGATDNYYASLNDDNGDGKIDDWDNIPDIKIGRFPVTTEDELTNVVQKTIAYELYYSMDMKWLSRVLFVNGLMSGEDLSSPVEFVYSGDSWFDIENNLSEAHKEIIERLRGYDDSQEAIHDINEGVGLILYHGGHGTVNRLSDFFSVKYIEQLSNTPYYPIVLAFSCFSGAFQIQDEKYEDYDCLGERLLIAPQKGCIAYFGASSSHSIWTGNPEVKLFSEVMFTENQNFLGDVIFTWKNKDDVTNKHRQILNLLGDPALDISKVILTYSDKPELTLRDLQFSNSLPNIGDKITITVMAENLGLTPVDEVKVRFFKGNPDNGGIQIGSEHLLSLSAESSQLVTQPWIVDEWGDFYIYAKIEATTPIEESCSENNRTYLKATTCMKGWPKLAQGRIDKKNIADIDPNYAGQEIVAISACGRVYIWHGDGTEAPGWEGGKWLDSELNSQPAIADVDPAYPGLEIVISSMDRRIFAFHDDGTEMLRGSNGVFAILDNFNFHYPAIADIDKDYPGLEVIVTQTHGKIYAFHADGTSMLEGQNGLFVQLPDGHLIFPGATLADIDLDDEIEIIVLSADASVYKEKIFAWNPDGQAVDGWEGGIKPQPNLRYQISPAVAELDPAYPGLEIVLSTSHGKVPLVVVHADGTIMEDWNITLTEESASDGNIVIGDFDPYYSGPEVLFIRRIRRQQTVGSYTYDYRLYAFHYDGTAVSGWEQGIEIPAPATPPVFGDRYYFSLADIDGDEEIEAIAACTNGLIVAVNNDGTFVSGWGKKQAGYFLQDAPSIADIDGNGTVDLAIGSLDWSCYAWDLGAPLNRELMDWPLWQQNPANTGWFNPGNRAPRIKPLTNLTVNEGELIQFNIEAADLNFDPLTFSVQDLPEGAIFDPLTHLFSWTPNFTQAGTYSVKFLVSDGELISSEVVTISVNNVNQPPQMLYLKNLYNRFLFWCGYDQEDAYRLRYSYRVDRENWSKPLAIRWLPISSLEAKLKLRPGKHIFEVKAIDKEGLESEPKATSFYIIRRHRFQIKFPSFYLPK